MRTLLIPRIVPVRTLLHLGVVAASFAGPAVRPGTAQERRPSLEKSSRRFRALIDEGQYELAGAYLRSFVAASPTDQDLLDLEKKYGPTVFQSLRTVPKWSDDPAANKQSRDAVEELVKRGTAVTTALLRNPERVNKYIRNLGASYEERVFAEIELKRTGEYAVAVSRRGPGSEAGRRARNRDPGTDPENSNHRPCRDGWRRWMGCRRSCNRACSPRSHSGKIA